jgi:pimeloyl-ACP methyl ester carboxylesterase
LPARRATNLLSLFCTVVLIGCASIGVRPAEERALFETWLMSLNPGEDISSRTRQTLRQLDLERAYDNDNYQGYLQLMRVTPDDASADQVFALAELSYRLGRLSEAKQQPQSCQFYYLCAGYSYHYLFALVKQGHQPVAGESSGKLLPFNCFDPRFRLACELYNRSLEKGIRSVQKHGILDPRKAISIPTSDGQGFHLAVTHHGFPWSQDEFGPMLFCHDFDVVGLDNHYRGYGLGVPMIGSRISPDKRPGQEQSNYFKAVNFPITAFMRFEGGLTQLPKSRCGTLELYNPLAAQMLRVANYSVPLETDLTTPLAYALEKTDLSTQAYTGFIWSDEAQHQAGIYMFEPYQKGKIPVLMVHGLLSSPLTWAPLFNDLRADPYIREHYQFWFYQYPTGNPYLATAAQLRQSLSKLRDEVDPKHVDPALDATVLVGHSMGGLINKLLTIPGGEDFWATASNVPLNALSVSEKSRQELQEVFYFEPTTSVRRAIFLATPHRGSKLSPSWLGRYGKKLVRLPSEITEVMMDVVSNNPDAFKPAARDTLTSVDLLDPNSPALITLSHRPRPTGVQYHSIVGVVKKNNILQQMRDVFNWDDAPGDGVVRYDSAHLEDAQSELVVQADHMKVHHHPRAVEEVRRILYQHLKELPQGPVQQVHGPGR